jgi:hypothetical protein
MNAFGSSLSGKSKPENKPERSMAKNKYIEQLIIIFNFVDVVKHI